MFRKQSRAQNPCPDTRYWRDPLSHPAIARMSERERADLPFDRSYRDQARP